MTDFKELQTIPPQILRLNTYQPSQTEYYTSADTDGIDARMTGVTKLNDTDFSLRVTLDYWRVFPKDNYKYKLFGQYQFKVITHTGQLLSDIHTIEAHDCFANIIKHQLIEMVDYVHSDFPQMDKKIFVLPPDNYILKLARSLPLHNQQ